MLELVAVLAVTALAAQSGAGAIAMLSRSIAVEAARLQTLTALVEARRAAYASQQTVEVAVAAGAHEITLTQAGFTLTEKRRRSGFELMWRDVLNGDRQLAAALAAATASMPPPHATVQPTAH